MVKCLCPTPPHLQLIPSINSLCSIYANISDLITVQSKHALTGVTINSVISLPGKRHCVGYSLDFIGHLLSQDGRSRDPRRSSGQTYWFQEFADVFSFQFRRELTRSKWIFEMRPPVTWSLLGRHLIDDETRLIWLWIRYLYPWSYIIKRQFAHASTQRLCRRF